MEGELLLDQLAGVVVEVEGEGGLRGGGRGDELAVAVEDVVALVLLLQGEGGGVADHGDRAGDARRTEKLSMKW